VASERSNPEALLTLKLKTESGDQVLLPLSERTTRQDQRAGRAQVSEQHEAAWLCGPASSSAR
jgi:hypothetical protein